MTFSSERTAITVDHRCDDGETTNGSSNAVRNALNGAPVGEDLGRAVAGADEPYDGNRARNAMRRNRLVDDASEGLTSMSTTRTTRAGITTEKVVRGRLD